MAIPQSEATLLSYFETGDKPTQAQFEEFIRTMFYLYNAMLAAAAAAQAAAEGITDSVEGIPKSWGRVRYDQSDNTITSDGEFNGVWSKTNNGSNRRIRFTFTNQPPHASHYLLYANLSAPVIDLVQNIAYIQWEVAGTFDSTVEFITFWPT